MAYHPTGMCYDILLSHCHLSYYAIVAYVLHSWSNNTQLQCLVNVDSHNRGRGNSWDLGLLWKAETIGNHYQSHWRWTAILRRSHTSWFDVWQPSWILGPFSLWYTGVVSPRSRKPYIMAGWNHWQSLPIGVTMNRYFSWLARFVIRAMAPFFNPCPIYTTLHGCRVTHISEIVHHGRLKRLAITTYLTAYD